jgi:hypothetical protein
MSTNTATSPSAKDVKTTSETPLEILGNVLNASLEDLLEIGRKIKSSDIKHYVRIMQYLLKCLKPDDVKFDFDEGKAMQSALSELHIKPTKKEKERIKELFGNITSLLTLKASIFFSENLKGNKQLRFQSEVFNLISSVTSLFTQERENSIAFHMEKEDLFKAFNVFTKTFDSTNPDKVTKTILNKIPFVTDKDGLQVGCL